MRKPEAACRVLVVIPAWNERDAVAGVVSEVRAAMPTADVLVVDDGSTDGTARQAWSAGAMVITLPYNIGVGGAMRAGYKFALRKGYDVAVQVDGDGQHDASSIPALVGALDGADVVVGARPPGDGTLATHGPRRWAMRLLAAVLSRVIHQRLTDVTSGFRAGNVRTIELFAKHYPVEYLGDTVEALLLASRAGLVITEVPTAMRVRSHGSPSQGWLRSSLYVGRAAMALLLISLRRRPRHPEQSPVQTRGVSA